MNWFSVRQRSRPWIVGVGAAVLAIYFYAMLIHPWIAGGWSWRYTHQVWYDWQSINAAFLALAASLLALNISSFREDAQRARKYKASLATLTMALADLSNYCKECVQYLKAAHAVVTYQPLQGSLASARPHLPPLPSVPPGVVETFSSCIESADTGTADMLASILKLLQIHRSRGESMHEALELGSSSTTVIVTHNVVSNLFGVVEIHARLAPLWSEARGEAASTKLTEPQAITNSTFILRIGEPLESLLQDYVKLLQS